VCEDFTKLVEATFPQLPIPADPDIKIHEGFGAKRIEALLPLGPDLNESRLLKDAEMSRYARLVNIDVLHDVVDRMLAAPQRFNNVESRRIGQGLERRYMHCYVYILRHI